MTTYALSGASPAKTRADAVVVGVLAGAPQPAGRGGRRSQPTAPPAPVLDAAADDVAAAYGRRLAPLLASLGVTGKAGEVVRIPTAGVIASPLLVLVGLGAPEPAAGAQSADDAATGPSTSALRLAAGSAARAVSTSASVALALPAATPEQVAAVTEGFLLGGYSFRRFKSAPAPAGPAEVALLTPSARRNEHQQAFDDAQVVAEAVAGTRDWVNTPPGDLRPPVFADEVAELVSARGKGRGRSGVSARVLDERRLAELGCGGLLAVGGGSDAPPRLVELTYRPKKASVHLALVGKGITFDSGGLTIKTGSSMREMKSDMAGAAAVVRATLAIAELGLPIRITAYAAMAENMVGAASMRPGDVITHYGGTTVEVQNTDAEGRLVMADALAMAAEQKPDLILDVATLTGHMVTALGNQISGVLGSDDLVARVRAAGLAAGEDFWPMPIPEAIVERVHSSGVADLAQHDWIRWGGGLFAGAFLREFTADLPWAHLDIAGPAFIAGARGHLTAGGTGVGVATLIEVARRLVADAA